MNTQAAIAIVRRLNAWRRGDSSEMLPPVIISLALDALCDEVERLEREFAARAKPHRGSDFNDFLIEQELMPTPKTDALWTKLERLGWRHDSLPISTIMESHAQLERELAAARQP